MVLEVYFSSQRVTNGKTKIARKEKKLRKSKEFKAKETGDLMEIDTVVRFEMGLKRYIITAVDVLGRPAFAYCYNRANSANTRDFFQKLRQVMPFNIKTVQTDNGSEFHKYFRDYLKEQNITHYWNYPGKPYRNGHRNGHIEKFNRTRQAEFIDQHEIYLENINEFNKKMIDWLLWYNIERPHWSLNLMSPADYLITNCLISKMRWTNTRL